MTEKIRLRSQARNFTALRKTLLENLTGEITATNIKIVINLFFHASFFVLHLSFSLIRSLNFLRMVSRFNDKVA